MEKGHYSEQDAIVIMRKLLGAAASWRPRSSLPPPGLAHICARTVQARRRAGAVRCAAATVPGALHYLHSQGVVHRDLKVRAAACVRA